MTLFLSQDRPDVHQRRSGAAEGSRRVGRASIALGRFAQNRKSLRRTYPLGISAPADLSRVCRVADTTATINNQAAQADAESHFPHAYEAGR